MCKAAKQAFVGLQVTNKRFSKYWAVYNQDWTGGPTPKIIFTPSNETCLPVELCPWKPYSLLSSYMILDQITH